MLVEQCQRISINEVVHQAVQQTRESLIEAGVVINGYNIGLTTTKTQFDGKRAWFKCPLCSRRCGVLLTHPLSRSVGCRDCLGVDYRKRRYKGMIEEVEIGGRGLIEDIKGRFLKARTDRQAEKELEEN